MRKFLTSVLAGFGLLCLLSFAADKIFTIKFTEAEINKQWSKLNLVKQIAEESNLPHQQVKFITTTIDSLQMVIAPQVNEQLKSDTTISKPSKQ